MPGVVRQGDMAVHDGYSPQYPTSWSPNVMVDGLPVITEGCSYGPHTNGDDTHDGVAVGTGTVYCNNHAVQIVGSQVSCGSVMIQGSGSVSIG